MEYEVGDVADVRMRTGKELFLATKPFASERPITSWWHVLFTGTLLWLALAGTLWGGPWPLRMAFSLGAGLLVLRFFVIYHDQQHHAILAKSKLAEGIMRIFGILVLSPSSIWRSSHNHHHAHNSRLRGSHIGSFPIMTREQFDKSSPGKRRRYLFMRHPATILFGYVFVFLFGMCLYPFLRSPVRHWDSLAALVVHAAVGVALVHYFGWLALVLTLVAPLFVACAIGSYLFYAQHNFPGVSFQHNAGWTLEGAALDSSSFLVAGPILTWFTANIGYHHLHHLNPRVPFYRLPEAVQAIPELQHPKTTSLHPTEIIRCLRLKVWDVDAQRMVGVSAGS